MKKTGTYALITASLALLVPAPGRFAYGLVLVLLLNLLVVLGTLFRALIQRLGLEELQPVLVAASLVAITVLYRQLLTLYSPLVSLVLGFVMYVPALSSFLVADLYQEATLPLPAQVRQNALRTARFSAFALAFFLFRDIFGYGTITLPGHSGLVELLLFPAHGKGYVGTFWASIPGALVLVAVCVMALAFVDSRKDVQEEEAHAQ